LATQGHFSLLDTDEDVGYLTLFPDRLIYVGDRINLAVAREDVVGVERRPIPGYSLFGYVWAVVRISDRDTGKTSAIRLLSPDVDPLPHHPPATPQLPHAL